MKKTISIILAIMMVATLSVSAFALDVVSPTNTDSIDVTVNFVEGDEATAVYNVTVTWADLAYDYKATTKEWNETTYTWDETTTGNGQFTKTAGDETFTVKNESSEAITATFTAESEIDTVNVAVVVDEEVQGDTANVMELAAAANSNAPTGTADFSISGKMTKAEAEALDGGVVATVTVVIAAA